MIKRPRQYAAEIIPMSDDDREEALKLVPEHLRNWVKEYIKNSDERKSKGGK